MKNTDGRKRLLSDAFSKKVVFGKAKTLTCEERKCKTHAVEY